MAKYESNLTQKEKDNLLAKSRETTRRKFSKVRDFFTRKRKTPAVSARAKKIKQAQADVERELPRGRPSPSQMEDYKPSVTKSTVSSFGQAFKKARLEGLDTFLFKGEKFSTATAEDVKESGSKSLREYLNKKLADEENE
jgi:hypothetical protein